MPALSALILVTSFLGCKKQTITETPATSGLKTATASLNTVQKAAFNTPDSVAEGTNGNWGKVNYDLYNNKTEGDSVHLSFDGSLCREIHAGREYKLGYVDITGSSLSSISLKDLSSTSLMPINGTVKDKENTVSNWYTFSDGHQYGIIPVKDRYLVLYKGENIAKATVLYVLQLNAVDYIPGKTSGYYFGAITFNYKRLI